MNHNRCIDAGRQGCPCALAESGNCIICGRLSGGSCQNCNWQGVCIYSLYEQNGRKRIREREEQTLEIVEIKAYGAEFRVFILKADRGFCQKAQTAGAYVFVRTKEQGSWYDAPVSVLKAEPEKERLHLGICRCGPKSGAVFEEETALVVRGVYYNALSGLRTVREDAEETLVYAKGIAAAPLRNFLDGGLRYAKWLKNLHIYMDVEKVGLDFFKDYFGDLPAGGVEIRSFATEGIASLDDLDHLEESREANVFALTSPYYADMIGRAAGRTVVRPTEGNLCCGEGICGACTINDDTGKTIRRCKRVD